MRILSGIQPTGRLHLGNYFGMMKPAIALQDEGEAFYFIANYHSLTAVHEPEILRENVRDVAIDFLACGLDPEKATFFRQSDVPEVTELTWILSTATPMGLLERCHSYKDKLAHGGKPSHGLFSYPVLMAADILIYDSDVVPVGKDQVQHLEVTRDIAIKINERYGDEVLKLPAARVQKHTAKVPGLDGEKMSKSYSNTIAIFEEGKALKKKIMGIKTDSTPVEDPKDPDSSIILELFMLVADETDVAAMRKDFEKGGIGYGDFKKRLLSAVDGYFTPLREKREQLQNDPSFVEDVLQSGAAKARAEARIVLDRVKNAVGL